MFFKLLLAFTLIPVIELYILIEIGSVIGGLNTVAIIILTGITGAWLARMQGIQILSQIQKKLQTGELPHDEMVQGVVVFIGGVTLLTPGFITDFLGLCLITPPTRKFFARVIKNYFKQNINSKTWVIQSKDYEVL